MQIYFISGRKLVKIVTCDISIKIEIEKLKYVISITIEIDISNIFEIESNRR